jgi:hypothetical protein
MPYAILRTAKLKTAGNIGALNEHLQRTRLTPNADTELTRFNSQLAGSKDLAADVQARLTQAGCTVRSNAVLAVEHLITFSPEFLDIRKDVNEEGKAILRVYPPEDLAKYQAWRESTMEWLHERYGKENVVNVVLHLDEQTPHVHAVVVPIDERGKLNCRAYLGGREKMKQMQTDFAIKMAPLGLQRGVEGSKAEHQEVKRFYGLVKELNPQLAQDVQAQRQAAEQRIQQAERDRSQSQKGGIGM